MKPSFLRAEIGHQLGGSLACRRSVRQVGRLSNGFRESRTVLKAARQPSPPLDPAEETELRTVDPEVNEDGVVSNSVAAPEEASTGRGSVVSTGGALKNMANAAGVSLGPISLSFGDDFSDGKDTGIIEDYDADSGDVGRGESIASMTNEEWRQKYEVDGCVDLWVEEEFNAGSRLVGGRDVHKGGVYGFRTGEGPSDGTAVTHKVTINNRYADQVVEVEIPEDRYVLWEAEDNGLQLPYACRMGCCTACAVKVLEGEMYQPQALGISKEFKDAGYALMCVGYPRSDLVLETVEEDEVYDLQFGEIFAKRALNKNMGSVDRDDFAFELADMDE